MAYYGARKMKGQESHDLRSLANWIDYQKGIFAEGAEEKLFREKWRKLAHIPLVFPWLGGNIDKKLYESDVTDVDPDTADFLERTFNIDPKHLSKIDYGDPSSLEERETMYTGGMGKKTKEELEDMTREISSEEVPYWETYLGERKGELDFGMEILKLFAKEGGRVPKKYYGGGSVQDKNIMPTIAEYFNERGVTPSGSYSESLAEMLGRKRNV